MIHCPTCGSGLRFDIASQKTVCDHCRNSFEPESLPDSVYDDADTAQAFEGFAFMCPDCGAELMTTDSNDAVGFCPYCGGASVIHDRLRQEWKPNQIIPFSITKEQCKEIYVKEVKKNIFVSRKYRDPQLIEGFRGIYMPYCSYRTLVQGNARFGLHSQEKDVGNYYYETENYYTDLNISYQVEDDSAHEASLAFDDHLSDQIEPYDTNQLRPFSPGYLCGFYAETGNDDAYEYASAAEDKIKESVYDELEKDAVIRSEISARGLSFDKSVNDFMPMQLQDSNHRLYPVWFMSYRRGNKITYATVNGQTGKMAADLPLSPLRILIAILGFSALLFAALLCAMQFLPTIPATTTLGVSTALSLTGMYIMQHSFISTVGKTLHSKELSARIPFMFYLAALAVTVGIILFTTDGTVQQYRYAVGFFITIVAGVTLFKQHISQSSLTSRINRISLDGLSMQQNGILAEAKRFKIINGLYRASIYIMVLVNIGAIFTDTAAKEIYYLLSVVAAVQLFGLALMHIFFQSKVAMRKLPQFNKKGALYDEN